MVRFKEVADAVYSPTLPDTGIAVRGLIIGHCTMFHSENRSVCPHARSLQKRAELRFWYKNFCTEPIVYDHPDEIYAQEAAINRLV
jgi:hypothetical protein